MVSLVGRGTVIDEPVYTATNLVLDDLGREPASPVGRQRVTVPSGAKPEATTSRAVYNAQCVAARSARASAAAVQIPPQESRSAASTVRHAPCAARPHLRRRWRSRCHRASRDTPVPLVLAYLEACGARPREQERLRWGRALPEVAAAGGAARPDPTDVPSLSPARPR